jgi:capsular polysaccharide biosynthesis protein
MDEPLMQCRECQIKMFHRADIAIAIHGAGLTNTMFMRPGGVVIEVIPKFDTRHLPMVGIFPRLSGIIGLNHYSYYQTKDMLSLNPLKLIASVVEFAKAVGVQF